MYYPKSQIKSNLYTNGDKYALSTTQAAYVGYYYSTSGGTNYSGRFPNDGKNILLVPLVVPSSNDEGNDSVFPTDTIMVQKLPSEVLGTENVIFNNNLRYSRLSPKQISKNRLLPTPEQPEPTTSDYLKGYFVRYFVKKNNENIFFETSTIFYNLLKSKDSSIAFELYNCIDIQWQLSGNLDQVFSQNKTMIQLMEKELSWNGFFNYFNYNFSQYRLGL